MFRKILFRFDQFGSLRFLHFMGTTSERLGKRLIITHLSIIQVNVVPQWYFFLSKGFLFLRLEKLFFQWRLSYRSDLFFLLFSFRRRLFLILFCILFETTFLTFLRRFLSKTNIQLFAVALFKTIL